MDKRHRRPGPILMSGSDIQHKLENYDAINNQAEQEADNARKKLRAGYNRRDWDRYHELCDQREETLLSVYKIETAEDPQSWVDNKTAADMAKRKTVLHARSGAWATDPICKRIARCVKVDGRYRWRKADLDAYVASGGRIFKTKTPHRRVSVCVECGQSWPCASIQADTDDQAPF